jgi:hypothetical protein
LELAIVILLSGFIFENHERISAAGWQGCHLAPTFHSPGAEVLKMR